LSEGAMVQLNLSENEQAFLEKRWFCFLYYQNLFFSGAVMLGFF
jgi:hypothetical protein